MRSKNKEHELEKLWCINRSSPLCFLFWAVPNSQSSNPFSFQRSSPTLVQCSLHMQLHLCYKAGDAPPFSHSSSSCQAPPTKELTYLSSHNKAAELGSRTSFCPCLHSIASYYKPSEPFYVCSSFQIPKSSSSAEPGMSSNLGSWLQCVLWYISCALDRKLFNNQKLEKPPTSGKACIWGTGM